MDNATSPKDPTMDTELRRYQIESHQRDLRAEAAAYRLARGRQDRAGTPLPARAPSPRIEALRRALATMTTVRLAEPRRGEAPRGGSRL